MELAMIIILLYTKIFAMARFITYQLTEPSIYRFSGRLISILILQTRNSDKPSKYGSKDTIKTNPGETAQLSHPDQNCFFNLYLI